MKISVCFASKIVQKYQWNFTDLPQILYANMWVCLYVYWFHSVQLAFFELVFLNFLPPHTIWFDAMFWSISFTLTSTHHTQNLIEIFFQTDLFLFRYFFLFLAHFFHLFSSLYYVPNTRIVNEIFNIFYLDLKTISFHSLCEWRNWFANHIRWYKKKMNGKNEVVYGCHWKYIQYDENHYIKQCQTKLSIK